MVVIIFPYKLRVEDPKNLAAPQQIIGEAVASKGVQVLDLLPIFESQVEEHSLTPEDLFFDSNHLTPLGHEMAARSVVHLLQDEAPYP